LTQPPPRRAFIGLGSNLGDRRAHLRAAEHHRKLVIALIFLLPLLVGSYSLWRYLESYESTDDAQIDGHIHPISARISGYLKQVLVD